MHGELSPSVCCSSGKIGSNRRSRPKKDIVDMFDGLFFVDQNSQTSTLITRPAHTGRLWEPNYFTSALADSMDDDGTVVDRGPRGSGSLVVSLDVLK